MCQLLQCLKIIDNELALNHIFFSVSQSVFRFASFYFILCLVLVKFSKLCQIDGIPYRINVSLTSIDFKACYIAHQFHYRSLKFIVAILRFIIHLHELSVCLEWLFFFFFFFIQFAFIFVLYLFLLTYHQRHDNFQITSRTKFQEEMLLHKCANGNRLDFNRTKRVPKVF